MGSIHSIACTSIHNQTIYPKSIQHFQLVLAFPLLYHRLLVDIMQWNSAFGRFVYDVEHTLVYENKWQNLRMLRLCEQRGARNVELLVYSYCILRSCILFTVVYVLHANDDSKFSNRISFQFTIQHIFDVIRGIESLHRCSHIYSQNVAELFARRHLPYVLN